MTAVSNHHLPRWNDQLVIRFLRDKLENEDELEAKAASKPKRKPTRKRHAKRIVSLDDDNTSDALPRRAYQQDVERTQPNHSQSDAHILDPLQAQKAYKILRNAPEEGEASSPRQAYNILRSLPGYTIGDPLRKQDKVLCYCKAATSYAMNKLRAGDCSFIMRSDGSFTYAIYEGPHKGDSSTMSFQVDNHGQGHFKRIPVATFCKLVKVPVLLGRGVAPSKVAAADHKQRRRGNRRASIESVPSKNLMRSSVVVSRSRSPRENAGFYTSMISLPVLQPDSFRERQISITSSARCCGSTVGKSRK